MYQLLSGKKVNNYLSYIILMNNIQMEKQISYCIKTNIVTIKNHNMSVFVGGQGKETIVLMAGSAQVSPILEFKPLINELQKSFRVVVIEKFGYGLSDIVKEKRTTDIILDDSRNALAKLEIKGPLILCPYSLSGLEALLWAQEYPNEVKAIIGIDMAFPYHYKNMNAKGRSFVLSIFRFFVNLGITYLIPDSIINKLVPYDLFSKEEKKLYRQLAKRNLVNYDIINEGEVIDENLKLFKDNTKPVPSLLLSSTGKSTGFKTDVWRYPHMQYVDDNPKSKSVCYDCGHELPFVKYKEISKEIIEFIK